MAIALVNTTSGSNYTGSGVTSIASSPVALTAGNLVVVCTRGPNVTGITDTLGNTYTQRAYYTANTRLRIFSCANCLGGSATITATFSGSTAYVSVAAMQFSGAVSSGEFVTSFAAGMNYGNVIDSTYDTGGVGEALIVGVAEIASGTNFNFSAVTAEEPAATYIEPIADHTSASFFYRLPAAPLSGATVRATSAFGGYENGLLIAVFRPLAAPGAFVYGEFLASTAMLGIGTVFNPARLATTQLVVETVNTIPRSPLAATQVLAETLLALPPQPDQVRVTQLVCELLVIAWEPVIGCPTTFPIDFD